MFDNVPTRYEAIANWSWETFEPFFHDLMNLQLTDDTIDTFLTTWSALHDLVSERWARLHLATTLDTNDEEAEEAYNTFQSEVYKPVATAEQELKEKLLASGLTPDGYDEVLKKLRKETQIFNEENIDLHIEERKVAAEYNRIIGGITVEWQGEELTLPALTPHSLNPNREEREELWRKAAAAVLEHRDAINDIWTRLMDIRKRIHSNAGLKDHRAYAWAQRLRLDYEPEDCETFHAAIEAAVVPAARRVYERRAAAMGVDALKPWDINVDVMRTTDLVVDPEGREPESLFDDEETLKDIGSHVFGAVDETLSGYYEQMRANDMMNLINYKGKAPGAYCTAFPATRSPFVFQNAVGVAGDISTLLHEFGHAFHGFERFKAGDHNKRPSPMEFNEVASMAMEHLGAMKLAESNGGPLSDDAYARFRIDHLEAIVCFWPYMAVVDGFQHWAYTNHEAASDPANCDAKWAELWDRFIQGVDWSDFPDIAATGWHRKLHLYRYPFYYVEYGMAQVGAVQVWRNATQDMTKAVNDYRHALSLGGTVNLPSLFDAAGVKFGFDTPLMQELVDLIEGELNDLYALA